MPTTKKKVKAKPSKSVDNPTVRITVPAGDFIIDRSRLIDYQQCPRMGYWGYGYEGKGLAPLASSVYLIRGSAIHAGVGWLLHDPANIEVPDIIEGALDMFEREARKGLDVERGEENPPDITEQKRVIEGALWAFYLTALPRLKGAYHIRSVEREEAVSLGQGVTLLARTDAHLQHKVEGTHHIWSLKTTKTYDSRKEEDAQTDIQGLSEALALEARIGQKIRSIQMCYLVLGKRQVIKTDIGPEVVTKSPFCWGYRRLGGGIGQGDEYYASQYWNCDTSHIITHLKKSDSKKALHLGCPGGKTHKIGDDFEMFPTDEYPTGIKGWIEDILSGEIKPGSSAIEELVLMPSEYFRQERDIVSFKRQAYWQAVEIKKGLEIVSRALTAEGKEYVLDQFFRQHKHRCHYPGTCDFTKLCFPPPGDRDEVFKNPLKFGYAYRVPNHPAETTGGTK